MNRLSFAKPKSRLLAKSLDRNTFNNNNNNNVVVVDWNGNVVVDDSGDHEDETNRPGFGSHFYGTSSQPQQHVLQSEDDDDNNNNNNNNGCKPKKQDSNPSRNDDAVAFSASNPFQSSFMSKKAMFHNASGTTSSWNGKQQQQQQQQQQQAAANEKGKKSISSHTPVTAHQPEPKKLVEKQKRQTKQPQEKDGHVTASFSNSAKSLDNSHVTASFSNSAKSLDNSHVTTMSFQNSSSKSLQNNDTSLMPVVRKGSMGTTHVRGTIGERQNTDILVFAAAPLTKSSSNSQQQAQAQDTVKKGKRRPSRGLQDAGTAVSNTSSCAAAVAAVAASIDGKTGEDSQPQKDSPRHTTARDRFDLQHQKQQPQQQGENNEGRMSTRTHPRTHGAVGGRKGLVVAGATASAPATALMTMMNNGVESQSVALPQQQQQSTRKGRRVESATVFENSDKAKQQQHFFLPIHRKERTTESATTTTALMLSPRKDRRRVHPQGGEETGTKTLLPMETSRRRSRSLDRSIVFPVSPLKQQRESRRPNGNKNNNKIDHDKNDNNDALVSNISKPLALPETSHSFNTMSSDAAVASETQQTVALNVSHSIEAWQQQQRRFGNKITTTAAVAETSLNVMTAAPQAPPQPATVKTPTRKREIRAPSDLVPGADVIVVAAASQAPQLPATVKTPTCKREIRVPSNLVQGNDVVASVITETTAHRRTKSQQQGGSGVGGSGGPTNVATASTHNRQQQQHRRLTPPTTTSGSSGAEIRTPTRRCSPLTNGDKHPQHGDALVSCKPNRRPSPAHNSPQVGGNRGPSPAHDHGVCEKIVDAPQSVSKGNAPIPGDGLQNVKNSVVLKNTYNRNTTRPTTEDEKNTSDRSSTKLNLPGLLEEKNCVHDITTFQPDLDSVAPPSLAAPSLAPPTGKSRHNRQTQQHLSPMSRENGEHHNNLQSPTVSDKFQALRFLEKRLKLAGDEGSLTSSFHGGKKRQFPTLPLLDENHECNAPRDVERNATIKSVDHDSHEGSSRRDGTGCSGLSVCSSDDQSAAQWQWQSAHDTNGNGETRLPAYLSSENEKILHAEILETINSLRFVGRRCKLLEDIHQKPVTSVEPVTAKSRFGLVKKQPSQRQPSSRTVKQEPEFKPVVMQVAGDDHANAFHQMVLEEVVPTTNSKNDMGVSAAGEVLVVEQPKAQQPPMPEKEGKPKAQQQQQPPVPEKEAQERNASTSDKNGQLRRFALSENDSAMLDKSFNVRQVDVEQQVANGGRENVTESIFFGTPPTRKQLQQISRQFSRSLRQGRSLMQDGVYIDGISQPRYASSQNPLSSQSHHSSLSRDIAEAAAVKARDFLIRLNGEATTPSNLKSPQTTRVITPMPANDVTSDATDQTATNESTPQQFIPAAKAAVAAEMKASSVNAKPTTNNAVDDGGENNVVQGRQPSQKRSSSFSKSRLRKNLSSDKKLDSGEGNPLLMSPSKLVKSALSAFRNDDGTPSNASKSRQVQKQPWHPTNLGNSLSNIEYKLRLHASYNQIGESLDDSSLVENDDALTKFSMSMSQLHQQNTQQKMHQHKANVRGAAKNSAKDLTAKLKELKTATGEINDLPRVKGGKRGKTQEVTQEDTWESSNPVTEKDAPVNQITSNTSADAFAQLLLQTTSTSSHSRCFVFEDSTHTRTVCDTLSSEITASVEAFKAANQTMIPPGKNSSIGSGQADAGQQQSARFAQFLNQGPSLKRHIGASVIDTVVATVHDEDNETRTSGRVSEARSSSETSSEAASESGWDDSYESDSNKSCAEELELKNNRTLTNCPLSIGTTGLSVHDTVAATIHEIAHEESEQGESSDDESRPTNPSESDLSLQRESSSSSEEESEDDYRGDTSEKPDTGASNQNSTTRPYPMVFESAIAFPDDGEEEDPFNASVTMKDLVAPDVWSLVQKSEPELTTPVRNLKELICHLRETHQQRHDMNLDDDDNDAYLIPLRHEIPLDVMTQLESEGHHLKESYASMISEHEREIPDQWTVEPGSDIPSPPEYHSDESNNGESTLSGTAYLASLDWDHFVMPDLWGGVKTDVTETKEHLSEATSFEDVVRFVNVNFKAHLL